ncbi:MAG: hypothetical protein EU544_04340 [Promethearchaeota archaeon]|nr:MAG: hypothetical protein EU544_04340 [Candidatus Lokiarchaeota archaeon]
MVEESRFMEFLQFQIAQKDSFFKKIPSFKEQLKQFGKHIDASIEKFERVRRRNAYRTIMDEFKDLLKKRNAK